MDHPTWSDPTDSEAWLHAAASGRLPSCPPGAIVAALRAQMRIGHRPATDMLARFISDEIIRRLRRMIGTNHRDRGEPMIERAHYELMNLYARYAPAKAFAPTIGYAPTQAGQALARMGIMPAGLLKLTSDAERAKKLTNLYDRRKVRKVLGLAYDPETVWTRPPGLGSASRSRWRRTRARSPSGT